jgi:hypothetical protein
MILVPRARAHHPSHHLPRVLFWFLTRQVRGAGMQAFTFGQSKARIIDPADTTSA